MKITRRRLLVAFVVTVAVTGGAWLAFAENGQPPFGVNRSAYQAIRHGMTVEEVERIIGYPTAEIKFLADFEDREFFYGEQKHTEQESDESICLQIDCKSFVWDGVGIVLEVTFTPEGLVCEKSLYSLQLFDRLLCQLRYYWFTLSRKLGF